MVHPRTTSNSTASPEFDRYLDLEIWMKPTNRIYLLAILVEVGGLALKFASVNLQQSQPDSQVALWLGRLGSVGIFAGLILMVPAVMAKVQEDRAGRRP